MAPFDPSKLKESEVIELKEKFNDSAMKTLSGFINAKGGSLYIGIKDDSTLIAGGISDQAQQDIVNKIIQGLNVVPEVILHEMDGDEFLEIKVKHQRSPVSFRGRYYKRVGNTTQQIPDEELKVLFLEDEAWDTRNDERFSLKEINLDTIQHFVELAKNSGRISTEINAENIEQVLDQLGLRIDGKLTNAAIILFGKNPQKYFPNAVIRYARLKDEATIIADRTVSGNLFDQVYGAEEQIKSFISLRYEITDESFQRKDVWQYPLPAIREALLNALVHRDYFQVGVKTQIKVFDDYLWIYNPGKLPGSLQIEDLKKPHASVPRNRLLTTIFYRAGLIEELGSGIHRIMNAMKEKALPAPEFEEQGNGFVIKLFGDYQVITQKEWKIELNARQKKMIAFAQEKNSFKMADLSEHFDEVDSRTLRRDLNELVEAGIFEAEGEKRGRTYSLK
ncbi:ATP-binding protein [Gracilimonas halophila]|uniref:ATP-binding protein n=1 Tax=Gracilimonas halophila TaxID=1834464 RepID=A0ABW5JEE1_9BACT